MSDNENERVRSHTITPSYPALRAFLFWLDRNHYLETDLDYDTLLADYEGNP